MEATRRSRATLFLLLLFYLIYSVSSHPVDTLELRYQLDAEATNNASSNQRQGWTQSPNQRGSIDILWNCLFTMFLCSWSILCLNIPSPKDSTLHILHRRFWLTCLCFLGPEFTLLNAAGQWVSARRSVEGFANAKIEGWTMYHAFFADMGGFTLHAQDSAPFPVDAKQLLFLVQNDFVVMPQLSKKTIADKNKVDGMLRIITLCQVLWFAISTAGRRATNLAITCFEITTSAFIVCTIFTVAFWVHKPADVRVPEILESDASISEIVDKAIACFPNAPHGPNTDAVSEHQRHETYYGHTPLAFISRKEWHWSLYWTHWINILKHMGINFAPKQLPVDRLENTTFLEVTHHVYMFWCLCTGIYTSIFVMAWNYDFPTPIEQTLWRVASVSVLGCLFAFIAITEFAYRLCPAISRQWRKWSDKSMQLSGSPRGKDPKISQSRAAIKLHKIASGIRNNSMNKDPNLEVPLKATIPMYIMGVVYCVSRTYILLADLLELRALPASAYETVNWSAFVPHI